MPVLVKGYFYQNVDSFCFLTASECKILRYKVQVVLKHTVGNQQTNELITLNKFTSMKYWQVAENLCQLQATLFRRYEIFSQPKEEDFVKKI